MRKHPASKPAKSTDPLPTAEWDFSQIPDNEVGAAHHWEYARESSAVRKWVERLKSLPSLPSLSTSPSTVAKQGEELAALAASLNKRCPRGASWMLGLVDDSAAAAALKDFPRAWLELPGSAKTAIVRGLAGPRFDFSFCSALFVDSSAVLHILQEEEFAETRSFDEVDLVPMDGSSPSRQLAVVAIDWTRSNKHLATRFMAWLRSHRPAAKKAARAYDGSKRAAFSELRYLATARVLARNGGGQKARQLYPKLARQWRGDTNRPYVDKTRACQAFARLFGEEEPPVFATP